MNDLITQLLTTFNQHYQRQIQSNIAAHELLSQLLGYHMGWSDPAGNPANYNQGKQLRPLVALLSCGAKQSDPENALVLAAAIELLHNFSLIHDDVMDSSETRRGRASVWSIWGVNQAINAGDGAYGLSFQLLAEADYPDPQAIVYAQRILGKACVDTVAGQMLDISFENRDDVDSDEYIAMVALKTGPLIGAALGGGALFAGADWEEALALTRLGRQLGVVFQMQDDLLGIWGKPDETGKSVSDDLTLKKKSYPVIWAMEHLSTPNRQELIELYQQVAPLPDSVTDHIREILTVHGVKDNVSAAIHESYKELVRSLENHYPTASAYRDELFRIVAFIVNRTY